MSFLLRFKSERPAPLASRASTLRNLRRGEEAVILEVRGSSLFAARLRELGFTPGVEVRVMRSGWTFVVQIGEGRLCLRRRDAASILIQPDRPTVVDSSIVVPDQNHRVELDESLRT